MAQVVDTPTRGDVKRMPIRRPEGQPRKHPQLTVVFDPETLATLEASAKRKGLAPTALIRMWVIQQLDREQAEQKQ